jgi:hypothetical protein
MRPSARRVYIRAVRAAALLVLLASAATPAAGQISGEERVAHVAINSALGALTAGVRQSICGCRSWSGLAQGAAGGAAMGVGKQLAGQQFSGNGLVGRQLHALGISAIASASHDHLLLLFPLGPLTLEVRPGEEKLLRARLDVTDLAVLAAASLDGEMRLDWSSTFAAGAPVLLHSRHGLAMGHEANGFAFLGTVFILEHIGPADRRSLVSHEAIHVLQWDAFRQLATHPAERVVSGSIPGFRRVAAHLDIGLLAPASVFLIGSVIPYRRQPWEREAYLLTPVKIRPSPLHPGVPARAHH